MTGAENGNSFTESFSTAATLSSPVGTYPIVPSVTGADLGDYTQSVTDGTLNITQAASTTSVQVSSTSITPVQSVTLTATVVDASAGSTGTPTGTVNFYDNGTLLDAAALSAGVASYSAASLTPGSSNVITAIYSGDANFTASSSTASAATTIAVAPLGFTFAISGSSTCHCRLPARAPPIRQRSRPCMAVIQAQSALLRPACRWTQRRRSRLRRLPPAAVHRPSR